MAKKKAVKKRNPPEELIQICKDLDEIANRIFDIVAEIDETDIELKEV